MPKIFKLTVFNFVFLFLCLVSAWAQSADIEVKPLVSLIVSGEDMPRAMEALDKARQLSRKVKVVNVMLVVKGDKAISMVSDLTADRSGADKVPLNSTASSGLKAAMDELGLVSSDGSMESQVFSRLRLSYSPTWIVRHEGKDYVFEGYSDISRYFTGDGQFSY